MTSKEKIRDIKSVINEFYHNEKCEGRLTECARKSWLLFQEYCDDILHDLEHLEALENENKKWREIVGHDLCEALGREILLEENEKLKKAIEILKPAISLSYEWYEYYINFMRRVGCGFNITQQEFELLKEVLGELQVKN